MLTDKIDAVLAFRRKKLLLGRDRVKVLEAVARTGSITRAAKAAGFSYKTAWDAVNGINKLSASPAFRTRSGGHLGGGAEITREGLRLIALFRRLEERLANISSNLAEDSPNDEENVLLGSVGLKVSTRNVFHTEVVKVRNRPVDVEVTLRVSADRSIHATETKDAVAELGVEPGRDVLAVIKSSFTKTRMSDVGVTGRWRHRRVGSVMGHSSPFAVGNGELAP